MTGEALANLRVVEIGTEITAPYCSKLLVDLGAEVHKVETPSGDPLRAWGPFPGGRPDPSRAGLHEYLNAGKIGQTLDPSSASDLEHVRDLIANADILIENLPPGALESEWGLDRDSLLGLNSRLVVVRISDFGQEGPLRDRETTSLTLQAASGWILPRDFDRPPVQAGIRIPEYVAAAYAALGALTGLRIASADPGRLVEVDVSTFESMLCTLNYPMLMAERTKGLGLPENSKAAPMLGTVRARDGWVGINCLTGQHWRDVCAMTGLVDFEEDQIAIMLGGPERDAFFLRLQPWLDERSVDDIVELGQAMRIPTTPLHDGASILDCPPYAERGFFTEAGADGGHFKRPGAPFRLSKTPAVVRTQAPKLGDRVALSDRVSGASRATNSASDVALPFAGMKILDLTSFWAGAYLTCYFGAFGADVVKVESVQRPDGFRFAGALLSAGDDYYERGPLWQGANLNKRDLTLNLNSARGRDLARQLVAEADVVVENYSPRVIEQFGMDYESLAAVNPGIIMVRMPGFGLTGPWRDYVGWALNIEGLSGMSAATGYADGPPCNLGGTADPFAGVHASIALLAALDHRERTGEGQLIEVAQIEVAAAAAAEPVIEYSMTGVAPPREGNRHRSFAQGVYPCREQRSWIALSVRDDADWQGLASAMGQPALAADTRFATGDLRRANHDAFDELVSKWTGTLSAEDVVEAARRHGVPAEGLLSASRMYDVPQLEARGFYEKLRHPITGEHRYPGWPFTITPGPSHHHRTPTPTLGQHNAEVLLGMGLTAGELESLADEHIIGHRLMGQT